MGGYPGIIAPELENPGTGTKTVAASGTAESLSATKKIVFSFYVLADAGNTGNIYLGDSTVDKTTNKGLSIAPGGGVPVSSQGGRALNLALYYIDADTNDNGVHYMYSE